MVHLGDQRREAKRVLVEFDAAGDGQRVSGVTRAPEQADPQPFSGWLDLMRLLEAASTRSLDPPTPPLKDDR